MTYKFDWTHVINGQIEIEAKNGVEAEKLFREMTIQQRLSASKLDTNDDALQKAIDEANQIYIYRT